MTKPTVKLIGKDGNIFNLMGIASRALRKSGQEKQITEMTERIQNCSNYSEALMTIAEYCEIE